MATLRWRGKIDAQLSAHISTARWHETDSFNRNLASRLRLYQLLFLDKIPAYAAVNEAVEIAKVQNSRRSAGFVNGVLRSFLRHIGERGAKAT